jgi:hypothetical protein
LTVSKELTVTVQVVPEQVEGSHALNVVVLIPLTVRVTVAFRGNCALVVHVLPAAEQLIPAGLEEIDPLTPAPIALKLTVSSPAPQTPALQSSPCGQTTPQPPQFWGSDALSHTPLHITPLGHLHAPATHDSPGTQTFPHAPQFDGSVAVATQALPHAVIPLCGQMHAPAAHCCARPHALPHAPQLPTSVDVFVHAP